MDSENSGLPDGSNTTLVTRKSLFDRMQQQDLPNFNKKLEYLVNDLLLCNDYSDEEIKEIKHTFSYLKSEFKQRWIRAHKKEDVFLKNNDKWLQGHFSIPKGKQERSGRPQKTFFESSERTKRRKTKSNRSAMNTDVLVHAAQT
ncbi:unnamed protein product [Acanthoscelides obtectus]|uniref:Uncharacterized protein n=1 Tax=Acanthoscelides obtectus TaxID=200917 RepID=A0A9P0PJT1_ACAOB|nr:unnamed protein product [Acanthoscelides obtectus]CAK1622271.1 hypothetical protein AOBTE_LOCUS1408 [Acanthoscelides obtectus]